MRFMAAGFFVFLSLSILTTFLHSQDQANDAIKEFKKAVADARKNYDGSIEGAKEKKDREIAAATQAALKALKDELSSSGPGEVARAIQLAKRICQLDPEDEEAKKILLAAGIDLDTIKPVNPNPDVPAAPKEAPAVQAPPAPPPGRIPLGSLDTGPGNTSPQQGSGSLRDQGSGSLRDKVNQLSRGIGTGTNYYPIEINRRPLTLPGGASQSTFALGLVGGELEYCDWDGCRNVDLDGFFFKGGAQFGASDDLTLGFELGYVFLSVDDPWGWSASADDFLPIELYSRLSLHKTETLEVAGQIYLPLSIADGTDTYNGFQIGLPTRFTFSDDATIALHIGDGLFNLGSDTTNINFWMGLGLQASDNVNLRLSLLPVSTGDTPSGTPFEIRLTYSSSINTDMFAVIRDFYGSTEFLVGWNFRSF